MINFSRKFIYLLFLSLLSGHVYSEFIILECSKTNNWTDERDLLYKLQIGTGSKKVVQVFKRNQLQMQLKETKTHYELGQYTNGSYEELIPLLKVNKETLMVDFSIGSQNDDPIFCKKL